MIDLSILCFLCEPGRQLLDVEVIAHLVKIDRARRSILGAEVLRCDALVVEPLLQLQDLVLKLVDFILQLVIFA